MRRLPILTAQFTVRVQLFPVMCDVQGHVNIRPLRSVEQIWHIARSPNFYVLYEYSPTQQLTLYNDVFQGNIKLQWHHALFILGNTNQCAETLLSTHRNKGQNLPTSCMKLGKWMHQNESSKTWTGPRFNIKMASYQYRKSHCGDKTILRPSYLHNGISYTGKTTSLYWIGALMAISYASVK